MSGVDGVAFTHGTLTMLFQSCSPSYQARISNQFARVIRIRFISFTPVNCPVQSQSSADGCSRLSVVTMMHLRVEYFNQAV